MQLFYSIDIDNQQIVFRDEELRHLSVLRKTIGDLIHSTDGKGNLYSSILLSISKKEAIAKILTCDIKELPTNSNIHLLIAPTKQMDRIEWMFEKLVEIGLQKITLIETKHSERHHVNIQRLEKIALSAMKQSLRFYLPSVNPIQPFKDCIVKTNENTVNLFAHCEDQANKINIKDLSIQPNFNYEIFIGPEGDFSSEEIHLAQKEHAIAISLSDFRLRTETAGLIACINLLSR